jgi:hypothetical protein
MINTFFCSVDLEPNRNGTATMDGIRDAMALFDETVPRGTVFVTYRILRYPPTCRWICRYLTRPVFTYIPRKFDYEHDRLAELTRE